MRPRCRERSSGLNAMAARAAAAIDDIDAAFDGADVRVELDLREALRRAGASAGDAFSLDVRASLACPKRTYDASVVDAEALGAELRRDASAERM